MIFIGLDPSITGFGYAVLETEPTPFVPRAGVWETFPQREDRNAGADNFERFLFLARSTWGLVQEHKPDRIVVESTELPFGKSAWNASLLGRCRGLVDQLGVAAGVPVIELRAKAVKKSMGVVRPKKGEDEDFDSKKEVRDRIFKLYPGVEKFVPLTKMGMNVSDAIAIAHVGMEQHKFTSRLRPAW